MEPEGPAFYSDPRGYTFSGPTLLHMKIYCLNLKRAGERRARITQDWMNEKGFSIEFFPAFDRREVEHGAGLPFAYDDAATRSRINRSLTSGEIACSISHALLLQHALDAGHEEIIVMEDDVLPVDSTSPEKAVTAVRSAQKAFPAVSVLLMHEATSAVDVRASHDEIKLLRRAPYGFRFVWLNRKAIKILINDLSRLLYPADWFWSLRFAPMRTVALLDPPLCVHAETDTFIGNAYRQDQRKFIP